MDCSPPGSSAHGILQARILERVATVLPRGGGLPDHGLEPASPALQADSLPVSHLGTSTYGSLGSRQHALEKATDTAPEGAKKQSAEQSGDEPRKAWEGTPQRGTGPPGGGDGEELGNTVSHGGGLRSSQGAVSWGV